MFYVCVFCVHIMVMCLYYVLGESDRVGNRVISVMAISFCCVVLVAKMKILIYVKS